MHPDFGLPVLSLLGEQMVAWGGAELFEISHACHLGGALAGWCLARRVSDPCFRSNLALQLRRGAMRQKMLDLCIDLIDPHHGYLWFVLRSHHCPPAVITIINSILIQSFSSHI